MLADGLEQDRRHQCASAPGRAKAHSEQLAHEAEIDLTYLGGNERCRRNPSVSVVGRIAASLGVHPRELFADE